MLQCITCALVATKTAPTPFCTRKGFRRPLARELHVWHSVVCWWMRGRESGVTPQHVGLESARVVSSRGIRTQLQVGGSAYQQCQKCQQRMRGRESFSDMFATSLKFEGGEFPMSSCCQGTRGCSLSRLRGSLSSSACIIILTA